MTSAIRGSAGGGGSTPPAPQLSHAIRALSLMLRDECNWKSDDEAPYGLCGKASHHEAREVIAAYKTHLAAVLAQMRAG